MVGHQDAGAQAIDIHAANPPACLDPRRRRRYFPADFASLLTDEPPSRSSRGALVFSNWRHGLQPPAHHAFAANRSRGGISCSILLCIFSRSARSQSPLDERQIRIAGLIRQLGSESYRDRFEAGDALAKLGPECRGALEAATLSGDAEIRLRATELLKRFKADDLWLAGLVSCRSRGQPASQVLATIAEQSGNHLALGQPYGTFHDANVDLDYPAGEFWPVVDDICRQTGNQVRSDFQSVHRGLAIIAGSPGKFPSAYAGPLRAQITEAARNFSEKLHFADGRSEQSNAFEFELNVRWEDRFLPVASRSVPEFVEATTDTGVRLTAPPTGAHSWNVLGKSERQLAARLRLNPPPISAKKIDRLVVQWGLIAVGDPSTLVIDDLAPGKAYRQDDIEATIERVEQQEGDRLEITLLVARDGPMPEPQEVLFEEYTVELLDAAGKAIRLHNQSNVLAERGRNCGSRSAAISSTTRRNRCASAIRACAIRATCNSYFATCRCRRGGRSESAGWRTPRYANPTPENTRGKRRPDLPVCPNGRAQKSAHRRKPNGS